MITRTISDPKMESADDSTRIVGLMIEGFSKPTFAESTRTPTFSLERGYAASSCRANSVATVCVRSRSNPDRSRPTTINGPPPRPCSRFGEPGCTTACMPMGTQTSGQYPSSRMPLNPRGATPVTTNSRPLMRTLRPTIPGSP
jgi:hypothetical protein